MKPQFKKRTNKAMTFIEVLMVIAGLFILAVLLLPILASNYRRSSKINCVSNLKQVGLAFRIWEGDHDNLYPMGVSVTNGGAMELAAKGEGIRCFQLASNEMSTTKIFVCPNDPDRTFATNFDALTSSNISYFIGVDATNDAHFSLLLSGDANFTVADMPVKSGLFELSSNMPVAWTAQRHNHEGNIGFADGSVAAFSPSGLRDMLPYTGLATNRLAIP